MSRLTVINSQMSFIPPPNFLNTCLPFGPQNVSETAAEVMISSTASVLDDLAALTLAQTNLVKAQSQASTVQSTRLPTQLDLESVVKQIAQSGVSAEAVEDLNRRAEEDLFTAEQAVDDTQRAL